MKKIVNILFKALGVFIILGGIGFIVFKPSVDPVNYGLLSILIGLQALFVKYNPTKNM